MDFNKLTDVNYVWFSNEGGFNKLLDLTNPDPGNSWTDEMKKDFSSAYLAFSTVYEQKGGKKLDITTGDALNIFLSIYGYESLKEMSYEEVRESLSKIWEEFLVAEEGKNAIGITLNPLEEKRNILKNIFGNSTKVTKVAFLFSKEPDTSDWLYGHELGRLHLEETYKGTIETLKVTDVQTEEDIIVAMEDLILMGVTIIFTTAATMVGASLKVAVEHPEVKILNCSLNTSHRYIRTYYARLYEAKFLAGMIAAAMTSTDKIGYLADYPIFGMTANINAFAMGARFINPRAKIYLEWTTLNKNQNVDLNEEFKKQGIYVVSDQDMITPNNESRQFGLYGFDGNTRYNLAFPIYNWGVFYDKLIESIISGTWKQVDTDNSGKAINYWWGLSAGVIDIILSNKLPASTVRLVEIISNLIKNDEFSVFDGTLYDQDDVLVNSEGKMSAEEIMKINWLAQNIVGEIPVIEDFIDESKEIIQLKGVSTVEREEVDKVE